jgi:protein-S-isoprenylcysteine O-methyltransferase Ste14
MMQRFGAFMFRYRNVIGPAAFLLAILAASLSPPPSEDHWVPVLEVAGVVLALAGQALRILTIGLEYIERGGRDRRVYASRLVQGGVFAQCRNPLYVGNLLICAGLSLVAQAWSFYLLVIPVTVIAYSCIVDAEEAYLHEKFGTEYEAYCARVPRWVPRHDGWLRAISGMRFNAGRVLVKEYNTFMLLGLSLASLHLWRDYRIVGPASLPGAGSLAAAFGVWLAIYLGLRYVKKARLVQD